MIIREAKRVLSSDHLFENVLLNLLDSEDIDGEIKKIKSDKHIKILDDVIELEEFQRRIGNLDADKLVALLGKIRGSVSSSTFNRIKETVIEHRPELAARLTVM